MLNGLVTTSIQQTVKLIDVRVWIPASERDRVSQFNNILLNFTVTYEF